MQKTGSRMPSVENQGLIQTLLVAVVALAIIGGCAMEALAYYDPPPAYYYPQ